MLPGATHVTEAPSVSTMEVSLPGAVPPPFASYRLSIAPPDWGDTSLGWRGRPLLSAPVDLMQQPVSGGKFNYNLLARQVGSW